MRWSRTWLLHRPPPSLSSVPSVRFSRRTHRIDRAATNLADVDARKMKCVLGIWIIHPVDKGSVCARVRWVWGMRSVVFDWILANKKNGLSQQRSSSSSSPWYSIITDDWDVALKRARQRTLLLNFPLPLLIDWTRETREKLIPVLVWHGCPSIVSTVYWILWLTLSERNVSGSVMRECCSPRFSVHRHLLSMLTFSISTVELDFCHYATR